MLNSEGVNENELFRLSIHYLKDNKIESFELKILTPAAYMNYRGKVRFIVENNEFCVYFTWIRSRKEYFGWEVSEISKEVQAINSRVVLMDSYSREMER